MNDDIVEIGTFHDEASAWVARAVLEASGIRSEVVVSSYRRSPIQSRARLAVRAEDATAALELLKGDSDR